jgi:peroxiredoxin
MHASSGSAKIEVGDAFPRLDVLATSGEQIVIPDRDGRFVHLQFRRFAGCPICSLHLRSIVTRHDEIQLRGIREVVVFHSTVAELAKYQAELPFPLIADPERRLYQQFGVERRPGSLLSGRALRAVLVGQTAALAKRSTMRPVGPVTPTGGPFGLPADFLIAPDGGAAAVKYGTNAYDQWTVDELLDHATLAAA